jgi:hypothetical protein
MRSPTSAFLQQARDRADGLLRDPSFPHVPGLSAPAILLPDAAAAGGPCATSCMWTDMWGTYTIPV